MNNHRNTPIKTTTVSVDVAIRDHINEEADRLGLSQREMVARLIEAYVQQQKMSDNSKPHVNDDLIKEIRDSLERVLKRDDRVIAFIKEQEKILLNPILNTVQATDTNLNQLIEILSNLS